MQLDSVISSYSNYAPLALAQLEKYNEALSLAKKIISKYPSKSNYYTLALVYSIMHNKAKSLESLEIAFKKGYVSFSTMVNDPNLANVKYSDEFSNLLNKYNIEVEVPKNVSDIDLNIPQNDLQYKYRFALIIGNEDYSSFQKGLTNEVNVAYARNDAQTFKNYCISVLGIPEKNITLLTNATAAQIFQGVDKLTKLSSVTNGQAEIFFYYAGHGLADPVSKESFLIPVDVSGGNLEYAVKMQDIYDKFATSPSKRTIVFLDACFSGGARNKELLSMRTIRITPKDAALKDNIIVFASSSESESSQSFDKKNHGLFTYFLLKKIQETKGDISYNDLFIYIKENVAIESILNLNLHQTPTLLISPDVETTWHTWKLND